MLISINKEVLIDGEWKLPHAIYVALSRSIQSLDVAAIEICISSHVLKFYTGFMKCWLFIRGKYGTRMNADLFIVSVWV